jgi:hypothetical protein
MFVITNEKQPYTRRFEQLSNEQLISSYSHAKNLGLEDDFLKMLLTEILHRDIYSLLSETSSKSYN